MKNSPTYELVDTKLGEESLAHLLATFRTNGMSFETIAYRLRAATHIPVTAATVRRWCLEAAS